MEFGRKVAAQRVVIVLHQHEGQERTWTGATLEFSNGEKRPIALKNTSGAQEFTFSKQECEWGKLADLLNPLFQIPTGHTISIKTLFYGKRKRIKKRY